MIPHLLLLTYVPLAYGVSYHVGDDLVGEGKDGGDVRGQEGQQRG